MGGYRPSCAVCNACADLAGQTSGPVVTADVKYPLRLVDHGPMLTSCHGTPRPDRTTPKPARRAGFTLVELLITVLIIGIAAGLAVPMLGSTSTTKLREAGKLLAADLAFAQNESITHGSDLRTVVFDTDTASYHIGTVSDPDTPITNPIGGEPFRVTFGEGRAKQLAGVSIVGLSMNGDTGATADRFVFGLYGQIDQASDATITLGADGMTITLTVEASTGETTLSNLQ